MSKHAVAMLLFLFMLEACHIARGAEKDCLSGTRCFGDKAVCCPYSDAVCCEDTQSCCPKGYACSPDGFSGCSKIQTGKSYPTAPFRQKPQILRTSQANMTAWYMQPLRDTVNAPCWDLWDRAYCTREEAEKAGATCLTRKLPPNANCTAANNQCWTIVQKQGNCYSSQGQCLSPVPLTCDWYTNCLNPKLGCGPDDYPLKYGHYYCNQFLSNRPKFNPKGQQWVNATMSCLQTSLIPMYNKPLPCPAVKDAAFKTHPLCYVDVTPSFCEIGLENIQVLLNIYKVKDFVNYQAISQVIQTIYLCLLRGFPAWDLMPQVPLVFE